SCEALVGSIVHRLTVDQSHSIKSPIATGAMSMGNRMVKLAQRPKGMVKRDDFLIEDGPVPQPGPGEFRVKIEYISLDPAMRGWMSEAKSYVVPVGLGEVMRAYAAGTVEVSNHPDFQAGHSLPRPFRGEHHPRSHG